MQNHTCLRTHNRPLAVNPLSQAIALLSDPRTRTRDLGGTADTRSCGDAVAAALGQEDRPIDSPK